MIVATLLTLFCALPIVVGYIANVINSSKKFFWYRQRIRRVRQWTRAECPATIFMLTTAIFFIVGLLIFAGVKFSTKASLLVLTANCIAALVFLYYYWQMPTFLSRHKELLKLLIAPLAIGVATISKIYSDAAIAELSGLSAQDLPGTQLLLTLILTPIIWLLTLSLAFGYASLLLMPVLFIKGLIQDYRQTTRKKTRKKTKSSRASSSHITALVAVFLSAVILLTIIEKFASKTFYEPRFRQVIAFASFHLPATYCGLPNVEGVEVAPMSDDRAALAISDSKLGYRFELITCKPARKSDEQIKTLLVDIAKQKAASALANNSLSAGK